MIASVKLPRWSGRPASSTQTSRRPSQQLAHAPPRSGPRPPLPAQPGRHTAHDQSWAGQDPRGGRGVEHGAVACVTRATRSIGRGLLGVPPLTTGESIVGVARRCIHRSCQGRVGSAPTFNDRLDRSSTTPIVVHLSSLIHRHAMSAQYQRRTSSGTTANHRRRRPSRDDCADRPSSISAYSPAPHGTTVDIFADRPHPESSY